MVTRILRNLLNTRAIWRMHPARMNSLSKTGLRDLVLVAETAMRGGMLR